MPRDWTNQGDVAKAFTAALEKAVGDPDTKGKLLDPTTAKETLAKEGDIDIPADVEVVFYREEDLPLRLVVAIPAEATGDDGPKPLKPTFAQCWRCTYDTYVHPENFDVLLKLLAERGII